jgi:hypothetical protein
MARILTGLGLLSAVFLALAVGLVTPAEAATLFVDATIGDDTANNCQNPASPCKTITHALTQANLGDTIQIAAGTYDNTNNGETFPLVIDKNLTLTGAGAPTTIIDADGTNTVITVNAGVTAAISGVTITGGNNICAVDNCLAQGGGVLSDGTVTLTNVTVSGNTATCTGGGCDALGAGVLNNGTLTLTNVTVSGNTVTCTGDNCLARGGGIYDRPDSTLTLTNVTVSGNTVTCTGDNCLADGGGLFNGVGTVTLTATIIALQLLGPDCATVGTITSNGFNLDSDNTCSLSVVNGDKPGVDPLLGPLANNGGPTQTHALLTGSPALDMVQSGCPPPTTDQRGISRPQNGDLSGTAFCDIGAYELVPPIPTLSEWAQLAMLALLLGGGVLVLRRNKRVLPA